MGEMAATPAVADSAEVHFAQRLASNHKSIRDKALRRLRKWLEVKSTAHKDAFNESDFIKLWKGLHYCLWMQDKPLLQEELTDRITRLVHVFGSVECSLLFVQVFFQTESREWDVLDKWRVDKFMMLVRRMLRETLIFLRNKEWRGSILKDFTNILSSGVLNPTDEQVSCGLRIHLSDVYLDELEKAGAEELSAEQVLVFLEPFFQYLPRAINVDVMKRVVSSVFEAIVKQSLDDAMEAAKKLIEKEEEEGSDAEIDPDVDLGMPVRLQYDYSAIADRLLQLGSNKSCPGKNRAIIYEWVKKFRDLNEGAIVGEEPIAPGISKRLRQQEKKKKKKKGKKRKAKPQADSDEEEDEALSKKQKSSEEEDEELALSQTEAHDKEEGVKKGKGKLKLKSDTSESVNGIGNSKIGKKKKTDKKSSAKETQDVVKKTKGKLESEVDLNEKIDNVENKKIGTKKRKSSSHGDTETSTRGGNSDLNDTEDSTLGENMSTNKKKKNNRTIDASQSESDSPENVRLRSGKKLGKKKQKNVRIIDSELAIPDTPTGDKALSPEIATPRLNLFDVPSGYNIDSSLQKMTKITPKSKKRRSAIISGQNADGSSEIDSSGQDVNDGSLLQEEVEIWIPNKKYKGKLKSPKEKIKDIVADMASPSSKQKSPGSQFAKFDNYVATPPAFFRKAASKLATLKSERKQSLKGLKAEKHLTSSATLGNRKRVSFDMNKNQAKEFSKKTLLLSTEDAFHPDKTPDQGILKSTPSSASSKVKSKRPAAEKEARSTPRSSRRSKAADFF